MLARGGIYLFVLAACSTVIKPPDPERRLNVHVGGAIFEAEGGFRFAALPDPDAKVIRLDVRYPVGSADDPPGKQGLAHLVEHLLFDVELARGANKTSIGAELGRLALSWNAETAADSTTYQTLALPGALDELVQLEVDRLAVGCAGLTPEIVAREREVVMNELRQRQGASGASLRRAIHEAIYPAGHPYRAVDSVDTVAKLTLDDVCAFLAGPYQRGKVMMIASGAVEGPALQAAAGRHIGKLKHRAPAASAVPAPVEPQPGTLRIKGDVDEPMVIALWPLPPRATREYRLLQMVWPGIPGEVDGFGFKFGWGHSADAWTLGGAYAPVLAASVTLVGRQAVRRDRRLREILGVGAARDLQCRR